MLVVMTGLPGTGKSAIADAIAKALPAIVLSADPIDAALIRAGVSERPDIVGYEIMKAIAGEQLAIGQSVVIDAVCPFDFVRDAYAELATAHGTSLRFILTECSDLAVHRRRIEERHQAGLKTTTWAEVEKQMGYYEPLKRRALKLDALDPLDENRSNAVAYAWDSG